MDRTPRRGGPEPDGSRSGNKRARDARSRGRRAGRGRHGGDAAPWAGFTETCGRKTSSSTGRPPRSAASWTGTARRMPRWPHTTSSISSCTRASCWTAPRSAPRSAGRSGRILAGTRVEIGGHPGRDRPPAGNRRGVAPPARGPPVLAPPGGDESRAPATGDTRPALAGCQCSGGAGMPLKVLVIDRSPPISLRQGNALIGMEVLSRLAHHDLTLVAPASREERGEAERLLAGIFRSVHLVPRDGWTPALAGSIEPALAARIPRAPGLDLSASRALSARVRELVRDGGLRPRSCPPASDGSVRKDCRAVGPAARAHRFGDARSGAGTSRHRADSAARADGRPGGATRHGGLRRRDHGRRGRCGPASRPGARRTCRGCPQRRRCEAVSPGSECRCGSHVARLRGRHVIPSEHRCHALSHRRGPAGRSSAPILRLTSRSSGAIPAPSSGTWPRTRST